HLDEHQLALDRVVVRQVGHLDDVDQLVELLAHLLEGLVVAVDDDRHPREVALLAVADADALDVEAAPAEAADDPVQDPRLVDEHGDDRVLHPTTNSISSGAGRSIVSERPAPGATIG